MRFIFARKCRVTARVKMKSFSSKERKELLKRWNERNTTNTNTTTNAKTNAPLLNSSNSDGMSLKEGKGTPCCDDDEENEKQIGNSKTFESRSSRSAGKTSTSKDEYDRDFRSKNDAHGSNNSSISSSSGVLRQRQEEAQQNVLMKRKKLSRDTENQRGTKDFAPDDEDWRMQSRNVWLSSYYINNKSSVVVAPTVDANETNEGVGADPNDFDDAFITRRGVDEGFVSKGQQKEESGREENIPNNNIAAEERKRTNTAATTSSKSKTSSRGGKEDKYLLYTQAMERLATKMKTENDEQMNQSKRLEEAQTKEHLMLKKSLEKEQMLNRRLEKDCESLKEKKLTAARERDRFSERVSRAEAEKERVLREIAKTKSKSTHLLKEHKFTIEAQGAMLEQLRRELETSEKMALDAERKCDAMTRERSETEERLANAREKLKSMEEKSTDQKQNSRAIAIAHEQVFSLTRELQEEKEINAKMEETNAKLQKEVNARKREFAEIQKQLESDVETERSLRVHAEKKMEKMMKEMQSIEEEKRKRVEELRVLEETLRSIEEERDALKKTVSQCELEIFKHLRVIKEQDEIENEWIEKYSIVQEEIEVRDLKAIESYNQVNNNNSNNEVQRKAAEIDRKEQFFSSKASSNNNHSKMLAVERQKVTDAMKAKRYVERQLQDEKRKLQEKEKMLNALEEKYAATAKRVNSDDTKAEEALKILNEKVAKMTTEMHEKDERLKANEELLHRMHSEKKKRDGELERMRVSLTQKDEVVKKLEDDLKSSEVQKANNNNNSDNQQQHVFMMKEKDATIQSAQSKVAALEAKAKQSSANEENLRKELEQLQKSERTAKAEREHLERQLRMAEEKEKKLSAQVDAMSVDRQKSSSNAAELFEANRRCLDLRAKCDAKDEQLEEMRLKLKEAKESYENEHKKHLQTQEDCAIYLEDLQEAAADAEKTICEHQRTIETNKEEMERLQTNLANAEKKCELASSEAQSFKTSLENTQTVLNARVEEIERFRSQSTSEKENMSSKLMFLEDESASLHTKLQEKQTKLNKALGDISKYQQESEQAKRQLDAFRASKEVTEERLREEQDKLKKSEQNCEQLSDMLKKNVERHANVLSANERMKNMEIEDLKDALRSLERKALKIAEVVHIDKAFFDGLDVEAQVIVEDFCATSKNVSSPTPSKMNVNNGGGKTPMTAPAANRGNFVSAPSSPADRFQTPQTSMQTSSRLGRTTIATTTTSKSAGKPVLTFSSAGKHQHKSHVSQRIWGMVSEASKINVDLQGLAESAKKRLQEHQEQLSEKKKINNSAVKALRLDVVNGEDSGQKPKPKAGTPSKRRVLQPVPFNAQ